MIKIYFNCCLIDHWHFVLESQLNLITNCGLIDNIDMISFHTIGDENQLSLFRYIIDKYPKVHHATHNNNLDAYESPALNQIYLDGQSNGDDKILYIHTKTVARSIAYFDDQSYSNVNLSYETYCENVENWRNILCKYSIENWKECLEHLNTFDACGPMMSLTPFVHFSGNFWWSKKSHIKKLLPPMAHAMANAHKVRRMRYCFESWIGSGRGDFVSTFTDPRPLYEGMAPQYFSKLEL